MDIERAIAHLLDLHAAAEVRMDRADARMDRVDARLDRTDKQIAAILKIIRAGAREIFKAQRENARLIKETTADLRRLERALLKPGGNHRPPRG